LSIPGNTREIDSAPIMTAKINRSDLRGPLTDIEAGSSPDTECNVRLPGFGEDDNGEKTTYCRPSGLGRGGARGTGLRQPRAHRILCGCGLVHRPRALTLARIDLPDLIPRIRPLRFALCPRWSHGVILRKTTSKDLLFSAVRIMPRPIAVFSPRWPTVEEADLLSPELRVPSNEPDLPPATSDLGHGNGSAPAVSPIRQTIRRKNPLTRQLRVRDFASGLPNMTSSVRSRVSAGPGAVHKLVKENPTSHLPLVQDG